jgi:hypothetical protein
MRAPLNQFADRILRNGEVHEFISGLLRKTQGEEQIKVMGQIQAAVDDYRYVLIGPAKEHHLRGQ